MWVKKCVEIREMLFKNWKLLFENTHQTPPKCEDKKDLVFSLVYLVWGVEKWKDGKLIYLVEKKNEKIENKVCIKLLSHLYYIIQEIISLQLLKKYFLSIKIKRISY